MIKTSPKLVLLALLLVMLPGLSVGQTRLIDKTGTEVVLERPAQRIVALAPHIVELMYTLGAGDQLVGVVSHSDYPKAALGLEQVGSYKQISYEKIAALKPDLVLSFGSGNGYEMINRLRELGFTVYVDEPRSLRDVAQSIRNYSVMVGREAEGRQQSSDYLARLESLERAYAQRPRVSVFYQVWNRPLITVNNDHIIADVIKICGGHNVFAHAKPLIPRVGVEAVVKLNPEVIIASGMGEERPEWLEDWKQWPSIEAVASDHLYFVPPDILQRHTTRVLDGAELLCGYLEQARLAYTSVPTSTNVRDLRER